MSHTIELPDDLYARLEALAHDKGQTIQDAATQVLQTALIQQDAAGSTNATAAAAGLSFIGMLGEPEVEPEPGWIERHDQTIAEEAMDPHAEE